MPVISADFMEISFRTTEGYRTVAFQLAFRTSRAVFQSCEMRHSMEHVPEADLLLARFHDRLCHATQTLLDELGYRDVVLGHF
jgi:hypothetical protein